MNIKKAIELLETEVLHGTYERYEALCMAIAALKKQEERNPFPDNDTSILACPSCGSGEYLHNADENRNMYCGQCGQRIDWSE